MQRVFAVLVVILLGLLPAVAAAQDAGQADATAAPPDAAAGRDSGLAYPPALVDEQGCDCQTGGGGGLGAIALIGGVAIGIRRSSRR